MRPWRLQITSVTWSRPVFGARRMGSRRVVTPACSSERDGTETTAPTDRLVASLCAAAARLSAVEIEELLQSWAQNVLDLEDHLAAPL